MALRSRTLLGVTYERVFCVDGYACDTRLLGETGVCTDYHRHVYSCDKRSCYTLDELVVISLALG